MMKTSGTAAASRRPTAGRVASASPPERPARRARPVGRAQQEAGAGEQQQREEEEEERIGQDLAAEDNERRRQGGENAGDEPDARRHQRAERGNQRAGSGIDHGLNERDRARNVAQRAPNAGEQQRIERHPIGHGQERRPKGLGLRQLGSQRPVEVRIGFSEEGVVAPQQRDIDQPNRQGEDKSRHERTSGGMSPKGFPGNSVHRKKPNPPNVWVRCILRAAKRRDASAH